MKTNDKTRKTMIMCWEWFFKEIQTKYKFGKYFKDGGHRTCAYNSENDDNEIIECAPRRQHGVSIYLLDYASQELYEKVFGRKDIKINKVYVTTSYRYGGVWVYDTRILAHTPTKPRNGRPYFRVNINECYKLCDLWDVFEYCSLEEIYHIARNQYEHMINDGLYDNIETWEDLPDYCLWKYQLLDGTVIPGREKQFEEYKSHTKKLSGYIPPYNSEESANE